MKLLTTAVLLSSLFASYGQADNCVYDCPTGATGEEVTRSIYTLSNNADTKFADWVAYNVTSDTINGPTRSRYWKADPDLDSSDTLEPGDYDDANAILETDRGHQVPLASFSNTDDWAMLNYLSNITPQSSDLNQGAWVDLETAVRTMVSEGQDVFVVSGPLYESNFGTLPEADETHTIPSGYFKVVITDNNGWVEASAFIMGQDADRRDDYCDTEVTVDEVESRSGLDLMPSLASYKENIVEANLGGVSASLGCE